jgi:chemotaxis protein MotB
MADGDNSEKLRPILIKKIKKGGHGHHGGAWKVAYADFVTAMMAFFLLLWLLSTSSKATLDGIAEYFTPTVGVKDSKGIGFMGGSTPNVVGDMKTDKTSPGIVTGQSPTGDTPNSPEKQAPTEAKEDGYLFDKAQQAIKKAFESDPSMREFADNILVEQTPEGLKIEMRDSDKKPMFRVGTAELTEDGRRMLTRMSGLIDKMPNFISITGHTDASSPLRSRPEYTNWELSMDRANAARRALLAAGMDKERPKKVTGFADKELIDPNNPRSPRNRRVTVILLRGSHMNLTNSDMPASRDLLSVTPGESLIGQ